MMIVPVVIIGPITVVPVMIVPVVIVGPIVAKQVLARMLGQMHRRVRLALSPMRLEADASFSSIVRSFKESPGTFLALADRGSAKQQPDADGPSS